MAEDSGKVWLVIIEWGRGAVDPFSLVESAWTDEASARAHAETEGSHARVECLRLNVPAGYE